MVPLCCYMLLPELQVWRMETEGREVGAQKFIYFPLPPLTLLSADGILMCKRISGGAYQDSEVLTIAKRGGCWRTDMG